MGVATVQARASDKLREVLLNRRMLICVFTGLASGMPFFLLIQLIPAWLKTSDVSLVDIGLVGLVTLPYSWKFLWAPLIDRLRLPLGRRRGWMLLTQVALMLSIGCLGFVDPKHQMTLVVVFASLIAFLSATQDVAIDAFRREILPDEELGLGNSIHVTAYRIAGFVPGSLSFVLADHLPWVWVFWITAAFMAVGLMLSLAVTEPEDLSPPAYTLRERVITPFTEYFQRVGSGTGLLAMLFLVTYKLGDNMATALSTPFYLDLGFSMTEIGVIAKNVGVWSSLAGGLLGGLWMLRLGINRALWIFGVVQMVSILGFAWLAATGYSLWLLAAVIGFEYLGVGLGTAAFTAFIARESSRAFAATQFALFTALAALPRSIASSLTGFIVEDTGWVTFFLLCTLLAVPGMVVLIWVAPWSRDSAELADQHKEG